MAARRSSKRRCYIEVMVGLALADHDDSWALTDSWDSWDIEHVGCGVRIEVKQAAALQPWHCGPSESRSRPSSPRFGIAPRRGFWHPEKGEYVQTCLQRQSDVYVFAWHPGTDCDVADHRLAEQWEFYVVGEHHLPQERHTVAARSKGERDLQKSIGLEPVRALARMTRWADLAAAVGESCDRLPRRKSEA